MNKKWYRKLMLVDLLVLALLVAPLIYAATEAPAAFDNATNGFTTQAQFDLDRDIFDEFELIADGLGPVYNAQACRECHQNPVSGATSQVTELRVARLNGNIYTDRPGGSLINDRAINPAIQERVAGEDNLQTFRTSLNILGDGFVEAIAEATFTNIRNGQATGFKGQIINVPSLEAPGVTRVGRFGWKDQHGSLLSFAADAYLNEMGITSPLQATENTSNGASTAAFDTVGDPEDTGGSFGADVDSFVRFMRSTKVPPRDTALAATSDAIAGANLFNAIGCNICHITSITTSPVGTTFNGTGAGKLTITAALGDKIIHPYSDFLLHDVGTGDFIIQNGGVSTFSKLRTPPLWGLRTRARFMHDGENTTRNNAILRHTNESEPVIQNYINLSTTQKNQLITFLNSL